MPKFAAEMEQIFDAVFAGSSIDPKTGKLIESDPKAIGRADGILKGMLEKVAKDKWLMKESSENSLSHMAGLINFEELNAGPSSMKTSPMPAQKAPTSTSSAAPAGPAGPMSESARTKLGFGKVFEALANMEAAGDQSPGLDGGNEVIDGSDSFENSQLGAGDDGAMSGTDADLNGVGNDQPGVMGDQVGDSGMGGDMSGQDGDITMDGAQDMGGQDNPLDFDLGSLDSFGDLGGQGGDPMSAGQAGQIGGEGPENSDEEIVPGSEMPAGGLV